MGPCMQPNLGGDRAQVHRLGRGGGGPRCERCRARQEGKGGETRPGGRRCQGQESKEGGGEASVDGNRGQGGDLASRDLGGGRG